MTADHSLAERYATRIEAQVDELVRVLAATDNAHWHARPADGEWSAAEICGHVAEMMPYWAATAQELAHHPGMTFGRDEQDPRRLGGVKTGEATGVHDAVEHLRAAAATACRTIRALPDNAWAVEGRSVSRGPMRVEQIIDLLLAEHLESHVEQVRQALG